MINIALIILLVCILLMMIGILTSKSLAEKLMSLNCMTNYFIVLFCMLSLFEARNSFVDIAYIFALFGFVINLGVNKLKNKKKL
jgi:multisubunit Na+/H+ antiporter MnhF subunit